MSTTALVILDGFGCRKSSLHNAIKTAKTPIIDNLLTTCPNTQISASGLEVGLPNGQMGNSEVGHMNIGAGRILYQNLTRISQAIKDGSFYRNTTLNKAIKQAQSTNKALHIMGLLSPGGVHSHEDHIHALIDSAVKQNCKQIYIHAFLDGRDCPPKNAESSLTRLNSKLNQHQVGRIASICGRYYAMDRDNRWERIQLTYDMITTGQASFTAESAHEGLRAANQREETDEFVKPTIITSVKNPAVTLKDGDVLIFMNFRSDRARQITHAFSNPNFSDFPRKKIVALANFTTLTCYDDNLNLPYAFAPEILKNTLGEYIANLGKSQLRIAETEKYAHVTFFFSGGRNENFQNETRILIPSPKIATYDLQPEMSAYEVTEKLTQAITEKKYDLIICNFANCDMVGHTGAMDATIKAVETIDTCIGHIIAALKKTKAQCLITADHGNAELMVNEKTGQPHTAHTNNPVPLVYVGPQSITLKPNGHLCDIAPSLLTLMDTPIPKEMTGKSLISP